MASFFPLGENHPSGLCCVLDIYNLYIDVNMKLKMETMGQQALWWHQHPAFPSGELPGIPHSQGSCSITPARLGWSWNDNPLNERWWDAPLSGASYPLLILQAFLVFLFPGSWQCAHLILPERLLGYDTHIYTHTKMFKHTKCVMQRLICLAAHFWV